MEVVAIIADSDFEVLLTCGDDKQKGDGTLSLAPIEHYDEGVQADSNAETGNEYKPNHVIDDVIIRQVRPEYLLK